MSEEEVREENVGEEVVESPEEESPTTSEKGKSDKPTLEELLEYARQGWQIWYERRYNRIRLRNPQTGKTLSIPYDPEIYERLRKAREEGKKAKAQPVKEPGRRAYTVTDVSLWNTFIGKHRPLIESLISRIGWLQDAVLDIGTNTLLFTLLISNEDPAKIIDVIKKIHDKETFVGYVMDKLFNLYLAAQDVNVIDKLREKIRELEIQIALLEDAVKIRNEEIERLKVIAGDLKTKLDMALSIMSSDELRRLMKAYTVSAINMYLSRRKREIPPPEKTSEEGGEMVE